MLVSTTVVSTRIRRPCATRWSRAICTIRSWICLTTTGPTATPQRPMVLASGILVPPTRVKSRYTRLALTSRSVTPVAHVLEHQQTQHHLGRGARPAAGAALRMPLGQGLIDRRHDVLVAQHLIGVLHPLFVQILDFLGNQPVTKAALRPPCLDHGFFLARLGAAPSGRSSAWLSSQTSSSASLSLW